MPRGDGTGPNGAGAMSGRGMGRCGTNRGTGAGRSMGRGAGRGMGRGAGRGMGCSTGGVLHDLAARVADLEQQK